MDKLQADKLTEIKANAELLQEEGYKSGLLDYVLYLLQLVETQAKALEMANVMVEQWKKAFVNADKQYLKMEKEAAELRRKIADCIDCGHSSSDDEDNLHCSIHQKIVADNDSCNNFN